MSTFRVQWEEKAPSASNPTCKTTQVTANSRMEGEEEKAQIAI